MQLKKTTDSFPFDEIGEREETVDESPSTPETIYINNEQKKQVQATVHTMMSVLTDRQREIIYYRYIKEMSIDEISKVTDMNNQSVSNSHSNRALGRIRDLFKRKIRENNSLFFLSIKKKSGKNFGKGEYKMKVQLLFIRKDNENDEL